MDDDEAPTRGATRSRPSRSRSLSGPHASTRSPRSGDAGGMTGLFARSARRPSGPRLRQRRAARLDRADAGHADRRAVLGPGLALRAQARRRAGLAFRKRRPGAAAESATAKRSTRPIPELVEALAAAGLRRFHRRRRDRRLRRRRAPASRACSGACRSSDPDGGAGERRHGPLSTCSTSCIWTGTISTRCRCAAARRCCDARIAFDDPLRFTAAPQRRPARRSFDEACAQGLGGPDRQARRARPTRTAARRDWLKFKCASGQELVIGGFTEPRGSRRGFGALLLGYYEAQGCATRARSAPASTIALLVTCASGWIAWRATAHPSTDEVGEHGVTWVAPEAGRASSASPNGPRDGKLRHPRFLGLRRDKPAKDVVRERTEPSDEHGTGASDRPSTATESSSRTPTRSCSPRTA